MKILMLGWELPPYNSGGLGVACYQLCKALAAQGCEIDFVVPYQAEHDISFMQVHAATSQPPGAIDGGYANKISTPKEALYTKKVHYLLTHNRYDVIHAHDWLTFPAAVAAKQASNTPVIAHVHATEFDRSGEHFGNAVVHDIEQQGLLLADHIVAVSELTKQLLVREYNISPNKIEVVHNSVDPADFEPLPATNIYTYLRLMKCQGYKVVVSTNRLTVQKGLTYLLRAAQAAVQKNPKLLFLLCASGEQYYELIRLSAELGISQHVLFPGFVRGKALRDAYDIADMFVMPSVSEPFGISALEAVGHGTVALVSKQSGVCEVVRNMLTFNYWDTQKLAEYILSVAEHPGLHQTLQANASQEFARLSWQQVAKKSLHLYGRLQGVGA
ncbi:MAG TPA: glycosyltransferase family 4 protein [Candidatus Saccharimonadales bacterium]|nr:glycosyltransferase family 4 protein [Candidatus Saccharimonadales bacterium]